MVYVLVLFDVFSHRFLIVGLLKTDNSLTLKQSVFLTGLSIRNLCPIKGRFGLDVPVFARLVWLRQTLQDIEPDSHSTVPTEGATCPSALRED